MQIQRQKQKEWIRGVNIGGWLVLERYITPYLFVVTDCDVIGNFHYFDNQIDAPPSSDTNYKQMTIDALHNDCKPIDPLPVDEWTLSSSFQDRDVLKRYLNVHYENFVKKEDLVTLKESGITHLRVPLSHWILGDISDEEPYVQADGWKYFVRIVDWAREIGLKIYGDLHTAPGSQNSFDNSGHLGKKMTCSGWDSWDDDSMVGTSQLPRNVERTIQILDKITARIASDGLTDVVTGFGILNEPAGDCNMDIVRKYYDIGLDIVWNNMGRETKVYVGDMFDSARWNDGFWADKSYSGTFLDSHLYQSFESSTRALSPRQHIALVCQRDHIDVVDCCYNDGKPTGMGRIFTEWSASYDQSVGDQVPTLISGIVKNGTADRFDRELSQERKDFLRNFVSAQMVSYEAVVPGESAGWFYWNFKMEGGIFAEWDYLRGYAEGWIPPLPSPKIPMQDIVGTCYDILATTDDNMKAIDQIPSPSESTSSNQGSVIDDDVVLSHGDNLVKDSQGNWELKQKNWHRDTFTITNVFEIIVPLALVACMILYYRKRRRNYYMAIDDLELTKEELKHVDTALGSLDSDV